MQNVDVAWYCGHVNVPAEMIPTSVAGPIVLLRNHNIFTYGSVTYILGMAPHLRNVRNIISTIGLNEARHRDNDMKSNEVSADAKEQLFYGYKGYIYKSPRVNPGRNTLLNVQALRHLFIFGKNLERECEIGFKKLYDIYVTTTRSARTITDVRGHLDMKYILQRWAMMDRLSFEYAHVVLTNLGYQNAANTLKLIFELRDPWPIPPYPMTYYVLYVTSVHRAYTNNGNNSYIDEMSTCNHLSNIAQLIGPFLETNTVCPPGDLSSQFIQPGTSYQPTYSPSYNVRVQEPIHAGETSRSYQPNISPDEIGSFTQNNSVDIPVGPASRQPWPIQSSTSYQPTYRLSTDMGAQEPRFAGETSVWPQSSTSAQQTGTFPQTNMVEAPAGLGLRQPRFIQPNTSYQPSFTSTTVVRPNTSTNNPTIPTSTVDNNNNDNTTDNISPVATASNKIVAKTRKRPIPKIENVAGITVKNMARGGCYIRVGGKVKKVTSTKESGTAACVICHELLPTMMYLPCTHACCCTACDETNSRWTEKCPQCRAVIDARIPVYVSTT